MLVIEFGSASYGHEPRREKKNLKPLKTLNPKP